MAPLPDPMLAVAGPVPAFAATAVEVKFDGCRAVVGVDGATVRARSRAGNPMIGWFPELIQVAADLDGRRVTLDGEVIAPDSTGRPDFGALQRRIGRSPATTAGLPAVRFAAFDVLSVDGQSVCGRPWQARRELLEELGTGAGPSWFVGPAFEDVDHLVEATAAFGLEGAMVKDRNSSYRPGRRSHSWVKVKHTTVSRLIVGGLAATSRSSAAMLVGQLNDDGTLNYVGCVEASLASARKDLLVATLRRCRTETSPFAPAPRWATVRWVEPRLIVEVRHLGTTSGGKLREPVLVAAVDLVDRVPQPDS